MMGVVVVLAAVGSGCYGAYDFVGDKKADRVWVTSDGVWHAEGRAAPL
jgi:hypothetical protein